MFINNCKKKSRWCFPLWIFYERELPNYAQSKKERKKERKGLLACLLGAFLTENPKLLRWKNRTPLLLSFLHRSRSRRRRHVPRESIKLPPYKLYDGMARGIESDAAIDDGWRRRRERERETWLCTPHLNRWLARDILLFKLYI